MKILSDFKLSVDPHEVKQHLQRAKASIPSGANKEELKQIFSLIDLTTLSEQDNSESVSHLCEKVNQLADIYPDMPRVAAICVYPELVSVVKEKLDNPLTGIASVGGGFPASQTFTNIKVMEIEQAIEQGAEEIDIVMQVGKFLMDDLEYVVYEIQVIKQRIGPVHLKVILETGSLKELDLIRKASLLAIGAGANFIKTSTGKISPGATPEAMVVMCCAIRDYYQRSGRKIGIKPAGGISDTSTALLYFHIVKEILGDDWLNSELFRIGASRLANRILGEIFDKGPDFSYF
ncbi:MAG: deoxyribose-phosphate aldolase [Deltaproteobacteria bacterium]|nr:MAG: deoxyribose-phosphate aldolase [Deltaproteobacteria bacterium]